MARPQRLTKAQKVRRRELETAKWDHLSMEARRQGGICSLCHHPYVGWGNNAAPYEGRCCDVCNDLLVLPARIARLAAMKP